MEEKNKLPLAILASAVIVAGVVAYTETNGPRTAQTKQKISQISGEQNQLVPLDGAILPAIWGDTGAQLVRSGVIDPEKFEGIYASQPALKTEISRLLYGKGNTELRITKENAGLLLNLLWALGLGNKNSVLTEGEMSDSRYGGADRFASTAGWTIAQGNPMDHYNKHRFVTLTPEQQELVDRMSRGIYRPCCGNSTHFPDCNHGMAMLGLLELMASQGVNEKDMWNAALTTNTYWFPDTYTVIARHMQKQGTAWTEINPQEVLSAAFSSSAGYTRILAQNEPVRRSRGSSCGV
jgi:hypothetical protein